MINELVADLFNGYFKEKIQREGKASQEVLIILEDNVFDLSHPMNEIHSDFYEDAKKLGRDPHACHALAAKGLGNFVSEIAKYAKADAVVIMNEAYQIKEEYAQEYHERTQSGEDVPMISELPPQMREDIAMYIIMHSDRTKDVMHTDAVIYEEGKPPRFENRYHIEGEGDGNASVGGNLAIAFTNERHNVPFNTKQAAFEIASRIKRLARNKSNAYDGKPRTLH